ncbi:D-arabinono-1,4-lactone oxidase [Marinitenerispora sediminis]|uniref:FAD-linked oxidoreductase n=1 Tax=Marinitenerispora sediminis TaxID=1931232 RepID=A0A368T3G5_9ACTN|nr:D-arabinono-1,4-lactone oxidase [Marinitenerispora sediminis]RCV48941.1 FAD-linked oxidoreductase [Marinitenerispora sediminis]RCV57015.1 FAD-linked oxidoreductase [Marinitenerispora sediminis]RCV58636.1 FAD-linked oxidoreductase [Marinitenerispora sediminis]
MAHVAWHTWGGTHRAAPRRTAAPNSAEEVAAAVRSAAADSLRVRMVGSGHSFTDVAVTDGLLLSPVALAGIRSVDVAAGTATVEAGLPLCDFNAVLDAHGAALANMGDIAVQTMAGAIQTGTHGTGRDAGGLATLVRGMELVLADGSVVECSAERTPDLFEAARVGLGAFGVVTALTMAVEPAFLLRAREEPMPLEEVLARLPELRAGNEHFEFYWFPHTGATTTKRNNRTPGPARPLSPARAWLDDEFLANSLFEVVNRAARRLPAAIPVINQVSARALTAREYVDVAHRVFASPRRVRFVEMEYAIPATELPDVLRAVRAMLRRRDHRISFPLEVRFAPADDVWLSTAYGRDTAYVAAHVYRGSPYRDYFADLEPLFTAVDGRPHWGKVHTRDRGYLERVYPMFGAAMAVRERVDPGRRFANRYLDTVLGA